MRKQRVLADGHISWACEAFSKLHRKELISSPALFWCSISVVMTLVDQELSSYKPLFVASSVTGFNLTFPLPNSLLSGSFCSIDKDDSDIQSLNLTNLCPFSIMIKLL